jgi:hypothetical protein
MQLGTYVHNARTHIFKVPNIRAIMGLQDVRVGSTVNAYEACKHVATMRLHCSASTMDHSPGTATVPSDSTSRCHTADQV